MRVVLAEKPSVARELAAFLRASTRADGYFEGQGYQVTWAFGHLVTLKEPEDYDPALKRWSLETLPIVPERFGLKLVEDKGARQQFAVIKRLFRAAEVIICATDAGREGELIFRYIQELAGATGKPSRRLWLNSLTEAAIRDAFRRLRPLSDYDALYALGNLLLISGRVAEAREVFEKLYKIAPAGEINYASEAIAKVIKAEDGNIGRANEFAASIRPKE